MPPRKNGFSITEFNQEKVKQKVRNTLYSNPFIPLFFWNYYYFVVLVNIFRVNNVGIREGSNSCKICNDKAFTRIRLQTIYFYSLEFILIKRMICISKQKTLFKIVY